MRWRQRSDREADLDRELRAHLDLEAEELRESGVAPHQAVYAAQCALGKDEALIENHWLAYLSAAFSALALMLAATGLFGLLSYHVASRTGEIGIRMALGAEPFEIHCLVLRQLVPVMAAGTAAGVGLTLVTGKVAAGLVYGVGIRDPRLIGFSLAVLAVTAVVAAWIPARRASAVDPLVALRHN